mmetsp:Transcript_7465/g.19907  ORF Transcript_7465/g.19907 Transcript_7465/m.19907 type:complete len:214 (+) Transcript_7465:102-743(+)|eukprot:CAMPEP_0202369976 /NCGR_PEP_ID=MMETSP1127-20130417/1689_1 /ASSEMBLY_ACC=CAM_ASM_000462 /TAXON_ID=3047 /ORGANISM="Dunaliella tertiolecta, Strain CCMP1320" /LENGTH=213 /DNA_ID=CAMNT_0048965783 /DNA_START=42 /DNA_END=683 /DNA_ORIENTATION=-
MASLGSTRFGSVSYRECVRQGARLHHPRVQPAGRRVKASAQATGQAPPNEIVLNVSDVMTKRPAIITVSPEESITTCLEKLVSNRITGMPVVDEESRVVGVVSDFDMLALQAGHSSGDLFPPTDETWQAFKTVQVTLQRGTGKKVQEVMTVHPITVRGNTNINDATSILLTKKIRRLPVVDEGGKLIGLISRANIVNVVLEQWKQETGNVERP